MICVSVLFCFVINVSSSVGYKFAARFSPLDILLFCFSSVNATTFFVATKKKLLDCIFPAWVSEFQVHLLPPDLIYFAKRGFISTTTKGKGERWLFYGVVEASDCGATGQSLSAFVCLCFSVYDVCFL